MSKNIYEFECCSFYVEKAGKDINGNNKYRIYAYIPTHSNGTIIKGIVKDYLFRHLGNNIVKCKALCVYDDKKKEFRLIHIDTK